MRIAVTGLGAVTALGPTRESTWQRLIAGDSGIKEIRAWDTSHYKTDFAGEAQDFDPLEHFPPKVARRMDRCHQIAIAAAREAVADSGLDLTRLDLGRVGIVIGSSLGGMPSWQQFDKTLARTGHSRGRLVYEYPLHVVLDRLTADLGFAGPRVVTSTACTASTLSIGFALDLLRSGQADVILTGGVDPLAEFSFAGFSCMKNVAPGPCAPFSLPIGLTTGEAAGLLIIEPLERAIERGAHIYAELVSHQLTADAYHPTSGDPTGASQKRAIVEAMERSGVTPDDIDYVCAHGTGTKGNDQIESKLMGVIYGERGMELPISSVKGALGHTLGAAGGIEALITVLAVARDVIPPTTNFTELRPGPEIDCVANKGREQTVDVAITQNFAFGGNNAAIVVRKHDLPGNKAPEFPQRRVVITGIGPISPIGSGKDEFLAALEAVHSGVSEIDTFASEGLAIRMGATVSDFDPSRFTRARTRRMDRFGQFTVCAAELAFRDAGLKVTRDNAGRIGIMTGTTLGPTASVKAFHEPMAIGHPEKCNPGIFPNTVLNAGAGLAAIQLRVKGCNAGLSCGQASGLSAVGHAYEHIRVGGADVVLAGGVEELDPASLKAFTAATQTPPYLGHLPDRDLISCPFDERRSGMVLGEGSVLLAVEALESAEEREAHVYAEILGYHICADRPVELGWDPSGEGLIRCMRSALAMAGIGPSDIQLVAAGAVSHPLHDRIEAKAINEVFGHRGVPVVALSSSLGGSAVLGAASLSAVLLGMQGAFLPAGSNYVEADPECDLDIVHGAPRPAALKTALVNSISYGGSNVSMVVRRYAG
jgi:3-oxoacyl-[acyl-carrier-protein] synthase II